jgi:hypothetical protein
MWYSCPPSIVLERTCMTASSEDNIKKGSPTTWSVCRRLGVPIPRISSTTRMPSSLQRKAVFLQTEIFSEVAQYTPQFPWENTEKRRDAGTLPYLRSWK